MALPGAVATTTLTCGISFAASGALVNVEMSVRPDFGGVSEIIWQATGQALGDFIEVYPTTDGTSASAVVPNPSQSGWVDPSGAAITNWSYTVKITRTYEDANGKRQQRTITKTVTPTSGQTTIDVDAVPSGTPTTPTVGVTQYEPVGTVDAAIAEHEAAADPHPQYTTAAEATSAAPVQSVAGKTGAVSLAKADVGLGNVDNTSDANKPVSTAQAAADTAVAAASLQKSSNLSDVASAATARTNLAASYNIVYKPTGLRRWAAAFADATNTVARINILGDSTTYGIGADGTQSTTDSGGAGKTAADQLRKKLNARLGLTLDAGQLVLPSDTRVTKTSAIASTSTGAFGTTSFSMQSSGLTMVFPSLPCTQIRVFTLWIPGTSGTWTYSVDGGGAVTPTASIGSGTGNNVLMVETISGLSSGSHSITLNSPTTGRVYVVAVAYETPTGIVVQRIGKPSATTADLIGGFSGSTTAAGKFRRQLLACTFNIWDANLTVVKLGINDLGLPGAGQAQTIQPAAYKANLKQLALWATDPSTAADTEYNSADKIALRNTVGHSVLLVVGPRAATVGTTAESAYWDAAKQVCDEMDHVSFINLADFYGSFADAHDSAINLQLSGSVHSTSRGYGRDAEAIFRAITSEQILGV